MSDQRPRMLMLATRVPARSGDGTPSFVLDHAMALADRCDITVLAPRIGGVGGVTGVDGVTVRRFAYLPRRWERLADDAIMPQLGRSPLLWSQAVPLVAAMLLAAVREHRRTDPDVVHAHWIVPAGLVALLLRALFGTPYLVTSHGADAFRLNHGPLRRLNRTIINRSRRFVAVSADLAQQFEGIRVATAVQPTGTDFSFWRHVVHARAPEPGRVLFVGRLDDKKGVATLLGAVATHPGLTLRVVGDGPSHRALERLTVEAAVTDRVTFLGRLSRAAVAEEFRTAMCLAIPSQTARDGDRDGTPTVLAEAIAAGVPVIGSRIAGIAEYVTHGETGLLHEPGDAAGLASGLTELLANPTVGERLAERARERLTERLDLPGIATRYARWIQDIVDEREVPRAG